jgi:hypothetical protein
MHKAMTILAATAALGGLFAASSTSEAQAFGYTFTEIYPPGTAPGTLVGDFNYGLNNFGQVVGGYEDNADNVHGYIYTGGKYVTFDAPSGDTALNGINDLGQIVGEARGETFIYSQGKFTSIASSQDFYPLGINDKGQILGENFDTGAPAVYAHDVFTPLPTVTGALFTEYNGFNNIGQFVGVYCNIAGCSGFIETKGAFTTIDDPAAGPGGSTTPEGINDWGQIVGSYCDSAGSCDGFLDTKGHFTNFEDPQASPGSTFPELINDVGQDLWVLCRFGW